MDIYMSAGIDLLLDASYPDAAYDSAARNNAPKCHPQTRDQYIDDFVHWAVPSVVGSTPPPPLAWMKGHAGMGKTCIAQSCVEKLKTLSTPFASFFFSINGRDEPERFFPTIAYQISVQIPEYRDRLNTKLLNDKTLVNKSLHVQFQELISLPLQELMKTRKDLRRRIAIFVDGLDECRDRSAQRSVIEIVAEGAQSTNLPLCWAFFSRPETHIAAAFANSSVSPLTHIVTLRKSAETHREVELYLRDSFRATLQRRNLDPNIQWPSDHDIKRLVKSADGMFIYGATALRFIEDPQWLSLEEPLRLVLGSASAAGDPSLSPFADMDALYLLIMQRIPTRALPLVSLVLTLICDELSMFGNAVYSSSMLGNCLGMSEIEVRAVCGHLSSVLLLRDQQSPFTLPDGIDTTRSFLDLDKSFGPTFYEFVREQLGGSISFFHKSFYDFLCTPSRSGSYCAMTPTAYNNLLRRLLDLHSRYDKHYASKDSNNSSASGLP
jgi:hypothetical protein